MKQIDGYAALLASANADVKRLSAYVDKLEAERDKWKESAEAYAETIAELVSLRVLRDELERES